MRDVMERSISQSSSILAEGGGEEQLTFMRLKRVSRQDFTSF